MILAYKQKIVIYYDSETDIVLVNNIIENFQFNVVDKYKISSQGQFNSAWDSTKTIESGYSSENTVFIITLLNSEHTYYLKNLLDYATFDTSKQIFFVYLNDDYTNLNALRSGINRIGSYFSDIEIPSDFILNQEKTNEVKTLITNDNDIYL